MPFKVRSRSSKIPLFLTRENLFGLRNDSDCLKYLGFMIWIHTEITDGIHTLQQHGWEKRPCFWIQSSSTDWDPLLTFESTGAAATNQFLFCAFCLLRAALPWGVCVRPCLCILPLCSVSLGIKNSISSLQVPEKGCYWLSKWPSSLEWGAHAKPVGRLARSASAGLSLGVAA